MTTLNEQINKIGKIVELPLNGMVVQVKVLDFKLSYGRERWLVTPVAGSGQVWVENVKFAD
jgi:hypothetical protein